MRKPALALHLEHPAPNFGVKATDELLSRLRSPQLGPRTVTMSSFAAPAQSFPGSEVDRAGRGPRENGAYAP